LIGSNQAAIPVRRGTWLTIHQYTLFTCNSATGGAIDGKALIFHRKSIRLKSKLSFVIFAITDAPATQSTREIALMVFFALGFPRRMRLALPMSHVHI
jgi:hypothetical protein